jgi:hypothetical protein
VEEAVEEDKRTTPAMERMVFELLEDGITTTTVGHVDLISNITV